MVNRNAWRWSLHPADPDYDDPPTADDLDDKPAPEQEAIEDYIRNDYPRNYWPMRGDV